MKVDEWITPEEAVKLLGPCASISRSLVVYRDRHRHASFRIYDGTEHPNAQAGMVLKDRVKQFADQTELSKKAT